MTTKLNLESISPELHPPIEAVGQALFDIFDNEVSSLYLVGSARRGDYIQGVSDIDFRPILQTEPDKDQRKQLQDAIQKLESKYSLKLDVNLISLDSIAVQPFSQFILLNDGLLLWGQEFYGTVLQPKGGLKLARHLSVQMSGWVKQAREALSDPAINPGDYARISRWVAKIGMRLAGNIAIAKGANYEPSIIKSKQQAEVDLPELQAALSVLEATYYRPDDTEEQLQVTIEAVDLIVAAAEKAEILVKKDD